MDLLAQIKNYLDKNYSKDNISAEEFYDLFISGFILQSQLEIEKFFDFKLIEENEGCKIIAHLKKDFELICDILPDFLLKKNYEISKELFGSPIELEKTNINQVDIKLNND